MAISDLENYAGVQERIAQFYRDFPDGSIRTFMVVRDGPEVIFEARAYRTPEEAAMGVYSSGWAREIEGKPAVNRAGHLENCESAAVTRALGHLGYVAANRQPSRPEMGKLTRQRQEHEAMLQFIRSVGPKLEPEAEIEVDGQRRDLKEFVRESWPSIKEQHRVARSVVEAIEAAMGIPFERSMREVA
jgi:hypothetical protein